MLSITNEYMSEEVDKENDKSNVIAKAPVVENKVRKHLMSSEIVYFYLWLHRLSLLGTRQSNYLETLHIGSTFNLLGINEDFMKY